VPANVINCPKRRERIETGTRICGRRERGKAVVGQVDLKGPTKGRKGENGGKQADFWEGIPVVGKVRGSKTTRLRGLVTYRPGKARGNGMVTVKEGKNLRKNF